MIILLILKNPVNPVPKNAKPAEGGIPRAKLFTARPGISKTVK